VRDNHCKAARSTSKGPTITNTSFNVADNGTLGYLLERQDITTGQGSLLTAVDELTGVHALGGNHKLSIALVTIGIQELNLGHRGTTTRIMQDLFDNTTNIATTLGVVNGTEFHGTLTSADVGFKDGGFSPSLGLSYYVPPPMVSLIEVVCIIQSP
jgi:hypothetical protein